LKNKNMFEPDKITRLRAEAAGLFRKHGLAGWTFHFDGARRRLGYCHTGRKAISMSARISYLNEPHDNTLTLLHEIAHALTPNEHHSSVWRAKCLEIGGDGEIYGQERPLSSDERMLTWGIHEVPQDFAEWAKIKPDWHTKLNSAMLLLEKWKRSREKAERMEKKYFKKVRYYQKKYAL
jgi:hypothetical protein